MGIDLVLAELKKVIEDSDSYKKYTHILMQVESNDDIKKLVQKIKSIQKQLVYAEHHNQETSELEHELSDKKRELYAIPLYQDYIAISDELKDIMELVELKIQTYLNSLNV